MAENKPVVAEKKSPKKLILIGFLILLLLNAAGAAYYFFVYKGADSVQADGNAGEQGKNNASKEEVEPTAYYELEDPLIVNFPPGSSVKIIKIAVTVLVQGEASVEVLKKHEPMIRNNLLMVISSIGADRVKTLEGKQELQAKMLNEIGKVMEKMAGKNTAKDVYFTQFVMQ